MLVSIRITVLIGLFACFSFGQLWASAAQQQTADPVVQPAGRLSITPGGVTLSENQAQQFRVSNGRGDSIAVHWNVSGLDCSGTACGTIDDEGNYAAPHTLQRAMTVTLEGVLVSDSNHSVLARIQLVPTISARPSAAGVGSDTAQISAAPVVETGSAGFSAMQNTMPAPPAGSDIASKLETAVTYNNGQLVIDAKNTTLAAVLKLVAERTGAVIDLPPGSGQERVVEHAGPGPANDVLTQLLNGSHLNFVIVSSPQHPSEPERVVLSVRGEDAEVVAKTVATPAAAPPVRVPPPAPDNTASTTPSALDSILTPPKEPLSPEALGELMKEKAREIREQVQQEAPPQ